MSALKNVQTPVQAPISSTRGSCRNARGFTLIEALIALAVMSIGLAGMARMNLNSIQSAHSSHYRSLASTIALDLEERLWLQVADNTLFGCPDVSDEEGSLSQQLIADWSRQLPDENWQWSDRQMVNLPNLQIAMGTPVTDTLTMRIPITLSWTENRFSDSEETGEQFTYTVQVICRPSA